MSARLEWLKANVAKDAIAAARSREGAFCDLPADDEEAFAAVVMCDPTPRGAYVAWLLKILARGGLRSEDLPRAQETLALFHEAKRRLPAAKRDIGQYASEPALYEAVAGVSAGADWMGIPDDIRASSRMLYEGPEGCVAIPLDLAASKWWGKDTRWCTTQDGSFRSYTAQGPLVVIVERDGTKHQFHAGTGQFADSFDRPIGLSKAVELLNKFPWASHASDIAAEAWPWLLRRLVQKLGSRRKGRDSLYHELVGMTDLERGREAEIACSLVVAARSMTPTQIRSALARIVSGGREIGGRPPADVVAFARFLLGSALVQRPPYDNGSETLVSGNQSVLSDAIRMAKDTLTKAELDRLCLAASPLQAALCGDSDLKAAAMQDPEVRTFLGGSREVSAPGAPAKVFRVLDEDAARSWARMHPEYPEEGMAAAAQSGSPIHALVGNGSHGGGIAIASMGFAEREKAPASTMHMLLDPGWGTSGDGGHSQALALMLGLLKPGTVPEGIAAEIKAVSILTRSGYDLTRQGPEVLMDAIRRVMDTGMRTLASGPAKWWSEDSGWRIRSPSDPFATAALMMQAKGLHRHASTSDCDYVRSTLFPRTRPAMERASASSLFRPVMCFEIRDPDGSRWLVHHPGSEASGQCLPGMVEPLSPDGMIPGEALTRMVKDRSRLDTGEEGGGSDGKALQPDEFLRDRPWLDSVPGVRTLLALVASSSGRRVTARSMMPHPTDEDLLLAARTDPLSLLSGVFGTPSPAAAEAAMARRP